MNKGFLEIKLKEIDKIIKSRYQDEDSIGVLVGLSGVSLFNFYYSKYLNINNHAEVGVEILTNIINKINQGYNNPTFCEGIAGAGWVLGHLEQEGFMEVDNDELLSELDQDLYTVMVSDMKNGNHDFLHGAVGYAFYFLNRYKNTKSEELKNKYKTILLEFVQLLEKQSEKEGLNKIKWVSIQGKEAKENKYNLGLSHGITGIIGILIKLSEYEDFKAKVDTMLKGSINYVMGYKKKESSFSLFPNLVSLSSEESNQSRMAWCYGDLGIGLQFWFASKVLNDKTLGENAVSILKHAAKRTNPEKNLVKDAAICHGSYGIALIFSRVYKETLDPVFKQATEFWIQNGMDVAIHKDGYAGYKQWRDIDEWTTEISLLEGITGIGLVIIDYLADFDTNWDECLMIS